MSLNNRWSPRYGVVASIVTKAPQVPQEQYAPRLFYEYKQETTGTAKSKDHRSSFFGRPEKSSSLQQIGNIKRCPRYRAPQLAQKIPRLHHASPARDRFLLAAK